MSIHCRKFKFLKTVLNFYMTLYLIFEFVFENSLQFLYDFMCDLLLENSVISLACDDYLINVAAVKNV